MLQIHVVVLLSREKENDRARRAESSTTIKATIISPPHNRSVVLPVFSLRARRDENENINEKDWRSCNTIGSNIDA
jgi:hypothetical protein